MVSGDERSGREAAGDARVRKPNFFVIGAMKAGTTSLYQYLRQHPSVFMSTVKEPHYFAFPNSRPVFSGPGDREAADAMLVTDRRKYLALFRGADPGQLSGEASAMYLYVPESADRIKAEVPDAKIIAILRNPADRAYSSYLHLVRDGRESVDAFASAVTLERDRIANGWMPIWHYTNAGRYVTSLAHYLHVFGKSQVKVLLYEDLVQDGTKAAQELFAFLGVDDRFVPETGLVFNRSGIPRSRALFALVKKPNPIRAVLRPLIRGQLRDRLSERMLQLNMSAAPSFDPELRGSLVADFKDDNLRLQDVLERDLSSWLP